MMEVVETFSFQCMNVLEDKSQKLHIKPTLPAMVTSTKPSRYVSYCLQLTPPNLPFQSILQLHECNFSVEVHFRGYLNKGTKYCQISIYRYRLYDQKFRNASAFLDSSFNTGFYRVITSTIQPITTRFCFIRPMLVVFQGEIQKGGKGGRRTSRKGRGQSQV